MTSTNCETKTIHVKLYLWGNKNTVKEIRRTSLPVPDYHGLKVIVQQMCTWPEYGLEYQDPEGDQVTFSSVAEWEECLRIGAYEDIATPLRLHVKRRGGKKAAVESELPREELPEVLVEAHHETAAGRLPCTDNAGVQEKTAVVTRFFSHEWLANPQLGALPEWIRGSIALIPRPDGNPDVDVNVEALARCLNVHAHAVFDSGCDFPQALDLFQCSNVLDPEVSKVYNMACCYARMGAIPDAMEQLENAAKLGYRNVDHLLQDEDLASVRSDQRFERLVMQLAEAGICGSQPDEAVAAPEQPEPAEVDPVAVEPVPLPEPVPEMPTPEPVQMPAESVVQPTAGQPDAFPFINEARRLLEMGFYDVDTVKAALVECNGVVDAALERLLL
eukprot:NODE_2504_length_1403_cov_142.676562_g2382_i0.p1 GENE.NODE_2504_length_1403_cov_142.676562_g2382_i0~~NODE_2504_length_1403_cov_142.676562_g2382_i0.p1  ORF type:complete len:411 (-),score=116.29 NODE_2504_length_1403_cov_142.676562_g2382_i0:170-1333(-)